MNVQLKPVRFAVVGYGTGGRRFHSPLIASAPECELVGVVTRSPERRALVAAEHPGARCFDHLEQAVEAGIEAVAISTPASTHSDLTDEAIGMGLHVVCDKPFALGRGCRRKVCRPGIAGRPAPVALPEPQVGLGLPDRRRLLDERRLGEVFRFESKFERFKPAGPGPAGGGALLDLGSHSSTRHSSCSAPCIVSTPSGAERASGLDDDLFVALTHVSDVRSQLWASWSQGAPGLRSTSRVRKGRISSTGPWTDRKRRWFAAIHPATLGDRWGVEPESRWGSILRGHDNVEILPTVPGAWNTFHPRFAAAIRGDGEVPVHATAAVATSTVLDAARQSATTGQTVVITT